MSLLHLAQNPTLSDIQAYMQAMVKERGFEGQSPLQQSLMLTEEVGELAKCIRKSHANLSIDTAKKYELDAAGEIADIFIVLTCIANSLDINIEQAIRNKEEKNKRRQWR
ncbi:MAG TPA: MazG nucleotide pyrophosphohydrolase domain-containing protein [Candidatus Saccharimonadales bacterium]|nr:MazG nucleotide pyrophosphohydrolase domain-containing protein [Candidatus Saccharimonadales bacterium]